MIEKKYEPHPIDTSRIDLPDELLQLGEYLAKNTHEVWAQQRINDGWVYGQRRDTESRTHPCLVPYEELPESEKEYDRNTSRETLKVILSLGYKISKPGRSILDVSIGCGSYFFSIMAYTTFLIYQNVFHYTNRFTQWPYNHSQSRQNLFFGSLIQLCPAMTSIYVNSMNMKISAPAIYIIQQQQLKFQMKFSDSLPVFVGIQLM